MNPKNGLNNQQFIQKLQAKDAVPFNQRYRLIKEAGKGAFGSVYKAEDTACMSINAF